MRTKPHGIVIGLDSFTGLQTARLLAARRVRVVGIAGDRRHFAARTRVCERIFEAEVQSDGFLNLLESLAPGYAVPPVLFPCTDQAVIALSKHRDRVAGRYRFVLPRHDVICTLSDKAAFAEHAQRHGLPIPTTFVLRSRAEAVRAAAALPYPAVLKPSVKTPEWSRHTKAKALPVHTPEILLGTYDRVAKWTDALVAQEFVVGRDDQLLTCNAYFAAGSQPLVTFVTRKRRQWPPQVGIASYAEEWRDDDVQRMTLELFQSVDFHGLGYLEVKRHPESGTYVMIEANIGRPTGRSATAETGGVELLATMYCDAAGLPLPPERQQRYVGASWIDLRRDLLSALYHWRHGQLGVHDWLRSLSGPTAHAVFSYRDPLPFAFEIGQFGRKAILRLAKRLGRSDALPSQT